METWSHGLLGRWAGERWAEVDYAYWYYMRLLVAEKRRLCSFFRMELKEIRAGASTGFAGILGVCVRRRYCYYRWCSQNVLYFWMHCRHINSWFEISRHCFSEDRGALLLYNLHFFPSRHRNCRERCLQMPWGKLSITWRRLLHHRDVDRQFENDIAPTTGFVK